jgi:hypothetical protein
VKTAQYPWLRLSEAVDLISPRLPKRVDATKEIFNAVSRGRLTRAEIGDGPLIRFPERPELRRSSVTVNRSWLVRPELDFARSTIVAPVSGIRPFETRLTAVMMELFREDIERLWPIQGKSSGTVSTTGAPGRPSKSMHLIAAEFQRRADKLITAAKLEDEAEALRDWLRATHPDAAVPAAKTVMNNIRASYRQIENAKTKK